MKLIYALISLLLTTLLTSCAIPQQSEKVLVQVSIIDALLDGIYDGETSFENLKKYGDFGLGTFNALDGEMIAFDGEFYQIKADGIAYKVKDSQKTPFAAVTFFKTDRRINVKRGLSLKGFKEWSDKRLGTPNLFYAFKVTGNFKTMITRSVPRQIKPYPQLKDIIKKQSVFEFSNVNGTIVGFKCPPYIKGVNVPGYHLHFLTKDKKAGGHVLAMEINYAILEVSEISDLFISLPKGKAFRNSNLSKDRSDELKKVEKE